MFLLATSFADRKPGYRADGKQTTLATCTVLLPLFQAAAADFWMNLMYFMHMEKNIFRYDSLENKFLEEQQHSTLQIKQGNKREAKKGNPTYGCFPGYCSKLHKQPLNISFAALLLRLGLVRCHRQLCSVLLVLSDTTLRAQPTWKRVFQFATAMARVDWASARRVSANSTKVQKQIQACRKHVAKNQEHT